MAIIPNSENKHRSWLVDGFNVLRVGGLIKDPEHWWGPQERSSLISRAATIAGPDDFVFIVFDGPREATEDEAAPVPGVRVIFAPNADDWLLKAVRTNKGLRETFLVTGDRALLSRAQHRGATIISPKTFITYCYPMIEECESPPHRTKPRSASSKNCARSLE